MLKNLVSLLLVVALASPAFAGDPLDTNDRPSVAQSVETDCARALLYPSCGWCVTQCVYAIIADMWAGGSGTSGWDWGVR